MAAERQGLTGPRIAWLAFIVGLGVVAYWRALGIGYLGDDYFQLASVEGRFGPHHDPFWNYAFAFDDADAIAGHRRRGSLPWWTVDEWRFGMLRPLSSLTIELDYRLFPRRPGLSHAHSYLWFAFMLFAAERLFERVMAPSKGHIFSAARIGAAIALLAFMVDEANAYTLMWIANRCTFVSAAFSLLAIEAHLRRRETEDPAERSRAWRLEWLWWLLAFAGGEYALCGVAFVFAYELVGPNLGSARKIEQRLGAMVPAACVTAVLLSCYAMGAASSVGLSVYTDPFAAPLTFVEELGHKLPRMMGEAWASIPGSAQVLSSRAHEYDWIWSRLSDDEWDIIDNESRHAVMSGLAGAVVLTALVLVMWGAPAERRRAAAWFALGSLLAMLPVASTIPHARLLVVPGLGVAGVIGLACERAIEVGRGWPRARGRVVLAAIVATSLVSLDVVVEWVVARRELGRVREVQEALVDLWTRDLPPEFVTAERRVVVLSVPDFITTVHGYGITNVLYAAMPATWHTLAIGQRPYVVARIDDDTLEMTAIGDAMFTLDVETSFRRGGRAFEAGERVDAGLFQAEIVRVADPGVHTVRFHFDRSLDDPALLMLRTGKTGITPTRLAIGERMVLPIARAPDSRR